MKVQMTWDEDMILAVYVADDEPRWMTPTPVEIPSELWEKYLEARHAYYVVCHEVNAYNPGTYVADEASKARYDAEMAEARAQIAAEEAEIEARYKAEMLLDDSELYRLLYEGEA